MRLEKRHTTSRRAMILAPAGAILFTLIVSALLVWWAWRKLFRRAPKPQPG